jgi:DedD protein
VRAPSKDAKESKDATAAKPPAPASVTASATPRAASVAASKPPAVTDAGRAQALLEGKTDTAKAVVPKPETPKAEAAKPEAVAADGAGRFVVQVGAFADANAARDVRQRVEKLGLKTYTQSIDTPGGKRIRVRVGPFAARDEAERVVARIKSAGLNPAVLTL